MVFDRRPEEVFADVVERSIETFKNAIEGVSQLIRNGESTIRELDDALTGGRPRFGETPQETFAAVLDMLHGTLEDAREKQSTEAASVVQKAREILNRINQVEPAWRPGPMGMTTASDVFRAALRDLRASNSLIRLAQGAGTLDDLKSLSVWADDLKGRLDNVTKKAEEVLSAPATAAQESPAAPPAKAKPKRTKKNTKPKGKPDPDAVKFALAVAEEYGDNRVKTWAQEFADGKISEAQWQSRLTNHAAAVRDNLDDVLDRAVERVAREKDAEQT
jgi:hypothetical protein